jgi:uncharacterized protein
MRIGITGASGLIGTALGASLRGKGHTVHPFVRKEARPGEIRWDPARGTLNPADLDGLDAIVHLAGENIAKRWTAATKAEILNSRVDGTRTVATALGKLDRKPRFLSCSAVGFYGDTGDDLAEESSPRGSGFLADVCAAWEAAADPARAAGVKVVHPRMGVVLSGQGGALAEMRRPFSLGMGGPVGSGKQWMAWIALADAVGALEHLIAAELTGPANVVAPESVRQKEFARALGHAMGRPAVMPAPAFAIRALFGEMGQGMLLEGQRVRPRVLSQSGFQWMYPKLDEALRIAL